MNTARFAIALCLAPFAAFAAATPPAAEPRHRPMDEMHGTCDKYSVPLMREMNAWETAAKPTRAARAGRADANLELQKKASVELAPAARVKLPMRAAKKFPVDGKAYAGVVSLRPDKDGSYRFSLGKKAWVDLVDAETRQPVPAEAFEMQTACERIFKFVDYALKKDRTYLLQISSSPVDKLDVLWTKASAEPPAATPTPPGAK